VQTSSSLADALLVIAEAFLAGKVAAADNPDVYQVIVHVGTGALAAAGPAAADPAGGTGGPRGGTPAGVSAETPAPGRRPGHPADPARCHVEDGPAISVSTAQMLTCTAALSWMRHDRGGAVLDAGRRRRRPGAALRRPPANATTAGAGTRAVSPAGLTCTTSSTGATAGGPA